MAATAGLTIAVDGAVGAWLLAVALDLLPAALVAGHGQDLTATPWQLAERQQLTRLELRAFASAWALWLRPCVAVLRRHGRYR